MPFALKNACATFNKMVSRLLGDEDGVIHFFDDVMVYSVSWEEHISTLKRVLYIFKTNGLTVRPKKVELGFHSISFLGHQVGNGALAPLATNIDKIL